MLVLTAILLLLTLAGVILLIVLQEGRQGDTGQLASRMDSFEKSKNG
jgi:preprotein translocase subunit SecG